MSRKIERLTIKGFKSIREIVDFPLGDVNVVVGANGAGKSNFVQIFRMVRAMIRKDFQNFIASHGGAAAFLHNGLKETKVINAEFNFGRNSYCFTLTPTADEAFAISEYKQFENYGWSCYGMGMKESRLVDEKDDTSVRYGTGPGVGYYVYDAISKWVVYHFHDTGDSSPMRRSEIVEDCAYLREDAANIAPFIKSLREDGPEGVRSYCEIVDAVRLVMPFFDDFTLTPIKFGPAQRVKLETERNRLSVPALSSFRWRDSLHLPCHGSSSAKAAINHNNRRAGTRSPPTGDCHPCRFDKGCGISDSGDSCHAVTAVG